MEQTIIQHQGVLTHSQKLTYLRLLEMKTSQRECSILYAKKLFLLCEELLEILKTDYHFGEYSSECLVILNQKEAKIELKLPIHDGSEKFVQRIKLIVNKQSDELKDYNKIWLRNCLDYKNRHLIADYAPLSEIIYNLQWIRLVKAVNHNISCEVISVNSILSFFLVRMNLIYS